MCLRPVGIAPNDSDASTCKQAEKHDEENKIANLSILFHLKTENHVWQ